MQESKEEDFQFVRDKRKVEENSSGESDAQEVSGFSPLPDLVILLFFFIIWEGLELRLHPDQELWDGDGSSQVMERTGTTLGCEPSLIYKLKNIRTNDETTRKKQLE